MSKELKDKKKAIWLQFPVAYGAFSLFYLGHAFKEVDNMLCLRLFKILGRQFDPSDIIKNFTTAVKIKLFSKEDDLFYDTFLQKSTLKEVQHSAKMQFPPLEFQEFKIYRERRLANIPLDKLCLELVREPNPSISLSGISGTDRSRSKSGRETPKHSKKSESDHNKSEGSVRDTAQSKECPEQQVLTTSIGKSSPSHHPATTS